MKKKKKKRKHGIFRTTTSVFVGYVVIDMSLLMGKTKSTLKTKHEKNTQIEKLYVAATNINI